MSGWRKAVRAFGRFWWEFLVGETPELLAGAAAAVAVVAFLAHHGVDRPVVVGALPLLVVIVLGSSARRARTRARRARPPGPDPVTGRSGSP